MNAVPPNVEQAGLRSYEQVRAFEAMERRRLPLIYVALTLLLLIGAWTIFRLNQSEWALITVVTAFFFACISFYHWQRLKARHLTNLQFLGQLEIRYGDQLPWIQVEKHFTALEILQAELEEERRLNERTGEPAQERPKDITDVEQGIAADEHEKEEEPEQDG